MSIPTQSQADRQTLAIQIASLDVEIKKLSKWFNSESFRTGSLMLSGKSPKTLHGEVKQIEFHELIVWNSQLPIPGNRLKEFLQFYCSDLIAQRHYLIMELEGKADTITIEKKFDPAIPFTIQNFCQYCAKVTVHSLSQLDVSIGKPTYSCNECEQ